MKKILSVSIIALFTIMPSLALAERTYSNFETNGFTLLSDEEYESLNEAEKELYDSYLQQAEAALLPAAGTDDAGGVYFGLKQINAADASNVATSKYVKGAYNQLTKRINKVYQKAETLESKEYEGSGSVAVCQDWDSDSCDGSADVTVNINEKTTGE